MSQTVEQRAAALVNQMIAQVANLYAIGQTLAEISNLWTNLSVATKINAFPTASLSATGGINAPDGSPNNANPINTGVEPGTLLNIAISANDIAGINTFLQGVAAVIGGGAVSANGAVAQLVAKCL